MFTHSPFSDNACEIYLKCTFESNEKTCTFVLLWIGFVSFPFMPADPPERSHAGRFKAVDSGNRLTNLYSMQTVRSATLPSFLQKRLECASSGGSGPQHMTFMMSECKWHSGEDCLNTNHHRTRTFSARYMDQAPVFETLFCLVLGF